MREFLRNDDDGVAVAALFALLAANPVFEEVRRVLIDSAIVSVHQHAAGARRKKKKSVRGGRRNGKRSAVVAAD